MYYLYHIPKRKEWGCTDNLERRIKTLGYQIEDVDRIITCGNIDMAANMECELNIAAGYGWNKSQDYKRMISIATKGAYAAGNKNKKTGHIYSLNYLPNHVNKKVVTCPHCGKEGKYPAMKQWHYDNCKLKT